MSKTVKIVLLVVGVLAFVIIAAGAGCASNIIGVRNQINHLYQPVFEAKSKYSAAINLETQKLIGIWDIYDRGLNHESQTYKDYAAARSGLTAAIEAFKALNGNSVGEGDLQKAQAVQASMLQMQATMKTAAPSLGINVQVENNPTLQWSGPANNAMKTFESSTNHCQMALDDWIASTKNYNVYVNDFWPELVRSTLFAGKFPAKLEYYEGELTQLDMKSVTSSKQ